MLAQLAGASLIPEPGGLWFAGEPISCMADNQRKGVSPGQGAPMIIPASPQFSPAHWATPEAEVTAALLAVAAPWLGSVPVQTRLHRWRSAYAPLNERGAILHDQAPYWGKRGIHYHQFLAMANICQILGGHPRPKACHALQPSIGAEAIHYAHQQGILHRDLKPSNVLIDANDQPRITDFGLAKRLEGETSLTLSGQMVGSPNFMPPEQATAKHGKVGLIAALMLVFVLGLSGVVWQWRQTQRANLAAEHREYAAKVALVQSLIADQEFGRAREILDVRTPERYRSWEWGWLQRQCQQDLMTLSGDGPLDQTICAVFDPATRILVTDGGASSNTVLLWDMATGQKLRTRVGHSGQVFRAAFSRDGRLLATSSPWDRVARIWDVATGREWRQLEHPDGVSYIAYSPDGKRLVTTCWDGKVRVWDSERWTLLDESPQYGDHAYCAEFSPDGRQIAYAGGYFIWANSRVTSVRIWNLESREVRSLEGHTQCVDGVAWNPKGDLLASCGFDGQVILWNVALGLPLARLEPGARPRALLQLSFSPDGDSLAIAGYESPAHPWAQVLEVPTLRMRYDLAGHSKGICGLAFSHDGQYLVTAAVDGTAKVWPAEPLPPYLSLEGHDQPVWAVAFSPNGDFVATGSLDQTAKICDAKSGALLQNLDVCFPVVSLAFSHGGDRLVTVGPDNSACVWQVQPFPDPRGRRRQEALADKSAIRNPQSGIEQSLTSAATVDEPLRLQGHTATVMAVAWSPDGRWILTVSKDRSARIWDARTGALQQSLLGHKGLVLAVAYSPKGKLVATGGADDTIQLWDARSGQCLRTLTNHQADVLSLAFSPDGNLLASGGADRKARLWDVQSGRQLHELSAAVNSVTSIAFSPNGTRLATANSGTSLYANQDREARIRLYDVSLGLEVLRIVAHTNAVYGVAFSPDGLRFATSSGDNTARIWTAFPWRSDDYPGQPELSLSARIENYKRQFSRAAIETRRRGQDPRTEPQLPRRIGVNIAGSYNLPPAGSKTNPRRPIPPRSSLAGPDQLDLTASYNVALNESWQPVQRLNDVDLSLAALPSGLQSFAGVRFDGWKRDSQTGPPLADVLARRLRVAH